MRRKIIKWLLRGIIGMAGLAAIAFGILILVLYFKGFFAWPDFSQMEDRRSTSIFLDEKGERIREVCAYCRKFAVLKDMGRFPEFAVKVEDKNFWDRWLPIDKWGVARAIWQNIKEWRIAQGGSTITQQLAKNTLAVEELEKEQKTKKTSAQWERKIREAYVAGILEWRLYRKYHDKESARKEILERYLNIANCGGNYYGVKACAHRWFDKEPGGLDTNEYAWIMALWRTPRYALLLEEDKEEALKLRNRVLEQLTDEKALTPQKRDEYGKHPLPENPLRRERDPCRAFHAAERARLEVSKQTEVADAGLEIHTTINCDWNRTAAEALQKSIDAMKERNPAIAGDLWGAALAIDARNGDIKISLQIPSFTENQYRIDQIKRHPGSAAKVFALLMHLMHGGRLTAQDEGAGPYDCNDSTLSLYLGKKAGRKFFHNFPYPNLQQNLGRTDLRTGITQSRNLCYLSLIKGISGGIGLYDKDDFTETLLRLKIELEKTAGPDILSEELAARMNIDRNYLNPGHTGVIGSFGISLWEMVRAWSAFYDGNMVEPRIVDRVTDESGELPLDFSPRFYGNVLAQIWIETQKEIMRREEVKRLWKKELAERAEAKRLGKPHADKSRRSFYMRVLETTIFDEEGLAKKSSQEAERVSLALIRGLRAPVELEHGTANLVRRGDEERGIPKLDFQIACKTGTATNDRNETSDNWIVCRTISHVMAVWIGRKNNLSMETETIDPKTGKKQQETGGGNALPVLIEIFAKIYETYPKEIFPPETDPTKPFRYKIEVPAEKPEDVETPEFID